MLAVILIGGRGERLRPLTTGTPKPLLPLVNKPCLEYQFDVLKSHGIRDIVLCTSYKAQAFRRVFADGKKSGLRLRYCHEPNPLGTGGALKNAAPHIESTTLVLNGDMLYDVPIDRLARFHRARKSELTIGLARVKDASRYGLVKTGPRGRVLNFVEKPTSGGPGLVNAGAYIIEPSILAAIPAGQACSMERSIFPALLADGRRVFGCPAPGYWLDIGTFDKYLKGHEDILRGKSPFKPAGVRPRRGLLAAPGVRLGKGLHVNTRQGRVVLGRLSRVSDGVSLTGPLCVGPESRIGNGARLEDSVLLENARVGEGAAVSGCLVGPRGRVAAHKTVSGGMVWT